MSVLEHARLRPRFGRVPEACKYAAVSKARFYQWARKHPQLIRKNGTASLVDFDKLDEVLDALPLKKPPAP